MGVASLAPLVHWRVCNVADWLMFGEHGYDVSGVLEVYGFDGDDIRTGCMSCFAVQEDKALLRVIQNPKWAFLAPILELKTVVYPWLNRWENRLRMPMKLTKAGKPHSKSGVVGPLTMKARRRGLEMVLDIQHRCQHGVELIDAEELECIYWHWDNNTWPRGWTGKEPTVKGEVLSKIMVSDSGFIVQPTIFDENLTNNN